jgi:hypothetical protein
VCCVSYDKDEGRPLGEGFQENSPNHFYDASAVTRMCEAIEEKAV